MAVGQGPMPGCDDLRHVIFFVLFLHFEADLPTAWWVRMGTQARQRLIFRDQSSACTFLAHPGEWPLALVVVFRIFTAGKENQMSAQTSRHTADSSASSRAASRRPAPTGPKNSGRSSTRPASGHELTSWNALAEMGRQQLAIATESASALYRGSEALRKVQQEAAHEASIHHAQAAQKLLGPCQPSDMLALQIDLMRTNMQTAAHYWQQMMVVALQTQREVMLSMGHLLDAEPASGMKSAMGAFQSIIPPMATSFFVHNPEDYTEPH